MDIKLTGRAEAIVRDAVARGEFSSGDEMVAIAVEMSAASVGEDDFAPTPELEAFLMERMQLAEQEEGRDWREVIAEYKNKFQRVS